MEISVTTVSQMINAAKEYASQSSGTITVNNPEKYKAFRDGQKSGFEFADKEMQSLIDENEKVKRLLHDLTPGGSEFYNDPEYCAKWIRESRTDSHYSLANIITQTKEQNKKLLDSNRELKSALQDLLNDVLNLLDKNDTVKLGTMGTIHIVAAQEAISNAKELNK